MSGADTDRAGEASVLFPLGNLVAARFLRRENRFRAEVELAGEIVPVHVPNTGRMRELLTPGAEVWLLPAAQADRARRKTAYTLLLARQADTLVCLYAQLANAVIEHWLRARLLPEFAAAEDVRREQKWGASRFDFLLRRGGKPCYVEVKSVNLLDGETARFPDAPTARGSRHLRELCGVKAAGMDAAVIFLVMGNAARSFDINWAQDPDFGAQLLAAEAAGVEVYVYACRITPEGVAYAGALSWRREPPENLRGARFAGMTENQKSKS